MVTFSRGRVGHFIALQAFTGYHLRIGAREKGNGIVTKLYTRYTVFVLFRC
jgi:hypothetical protein